MVKRHLPTKFGVPRKRILRATDGRTMDDRVTTVFLLCSSTKLSYQTTCRNFYFVNVQTQKRQ